MPAKASCRNRHRRIRQRRQSTPSHDHSVEESRMGGRGFCADSRLFVQIFLDTGFMCKAGPVGPELCITPQTDFGERPFQRLSGKSLDGMVRATLANAERQNETFHPHPSGARNRKFEPIRSFHTVSPHTPVNKPDQSLRSDRVTIEPGRLVSALALPYSAVGCKESAALIAPGFIADTPERRSR
jgi:hypothetical protein